ncbi:hypothetical protein [Jejuia pallidilutea]|uniref:hypothetical protein n=1 Tax=Jejuia pallidilutea TaxID=504487 RepID=UPI001FD20299|nr:hypothetical protein [Jejuia pallidilutea]
MKENLVKSQPKVSKKSLVLGSIIATLLAVTPFLFNLYQSVPNERVWNTFLFSYDSGDWESANYAMWIFTGKAVPLMLLLIWFFTNRHWWYHALIVPIFMYIYQIISIYNDGAGVFDEMHFYYMIPIMAIIVPSIYLIRARIFNKINEASKSLEELEAEFKISPKNFWEKIKQYF